MVADLLVFAASAAAIVAAGIRLAAAADVLAAGTGLGGLWIGAILVSAVTSLPELTTNLAAVWQGDATLAVGDLFGACMANMLMLAVADLATRPARMLARVAVNQLAVGTIAVCLLTLATAGLVVPGGALAGVGWAPAAIAVLYVGGMRFLHENRPEPPFRSRDQVEEAAAPRAALGPAARRFALASAVILVAAPFLAASTAALADGFGLGHGFAGMLLLALTTTMPEATVTLAAVRAGAHDLAVGNLFGSSCFNMAALLALDLADGAGSLLAGVDGSLAVGGLAAVLLTGLAMLGVLDRAERPVRWLDPGPLLMVAVYVAGLVLAYRAGP